MKKLKLMTGLVLSCFLIHGQQTTLITYKAPPEAETAPEFELEVNGQPVHVYNTRPAALAYFSFEGKVDVTVKFLSEVISYDIRPKNRNITAGLYRNQISFTLDKPENLSIEINGNIKRPLFLFANPPEKDIPERNDTSIIWFEGGKIYLPGEMLIRDNQTVYIEGGAVVRGHLMTDQAKNIKILGRGILDNSHYSKGGYRPVEINQCENVLIEGIIITESRHWSCASFASRHVTYRNLKIVSDNDWDDGIDIVGSQDVLVDNCFIRTKDDCIAIKAGVNYFTDFFSGANVDGVVVQNSVLWNGIWGNGIEIGFETRADTIRNIVFRNCDLIHVEGPEGTFTIHNGDRAVVKNVLYEDIRVEDAQGWLVDFRILKSVYTKDTLRGRVEDIIFRNIQVEGDRYPCSQIIGFDKEHTIKRITFDNFLIHGDHINSIYNGMIATNCVDELIFK